MAKIVILDLKNSNLVDLDNQQTEKTIGGATGFVGGVVGGTVSGLLRGKRGRALLKDVGITTAGSTAGGIAAGAVGGAFAGGVGAIPGAGIGAALV